MQYIGTATIVGCLSTTSRQRIRDKLDAVEGKTLPVLEKNFRGDCMCFDAVNQRLVDIDAVDVQEFKPTIATSKDVLTVLAELFAGKR